MEEQEKSNYRKRVELYILDLNNQILRGKYCIDYSTKEISIEKQKIELCEEAIELARESFRTFAGEEL